MVYHATSATATTAFDPWPYWVNDSTDASVTGANDNVWRVWVNDREVVVATNGSFEIRTGDPWPHWISEQSACITSDRATGTITIQATAVFQSEQDAIWSNWAQAPAVIIRNGHDVPNAQGMAARINEREIRAKAREAWLLTPEGQTETARQAAINKEYEEKLAEEKRRRAIAEAKAESLLNSVLTPEQRDEYKRLRQFKVHTPSGKVYRVERGRQGNLKRIEIDGQGREKVVETLCVHPSVRCPDPDTMIAQKLMLEANEDELRAVANIWSR